MSALVLLAWSAVHADYRQYLSWPVVGLVALVAVTTGTVVPVRVRSVTHNFSSASVAVLVGPAVLPPALVILCTMAGSLLANLLLRRAPIKIIFNVAKNTLSAATLAGVAAVIGGYRPGASLLQLVATVVIAALAYAVVDSALAAPVLALASHTPVAQLLLLHWDIRLGALGAMTSIGLIGTQVVRLDERMIIAVPVLAWSLHLAYSNRMHARAERDAWQTLAQSTDELNAVDLTGVLHTSVIRAAELFSADEVEVDVRLENGRRLVRGGAKGITFDGLPQDAPTRTGNTIPAALEGHDGAADLGTLRLRFHGPVKLSEREEYTLRTFASALCTAIRNAAAYDELARLADQHAHDAAHDPLTGLANRRRLQEEGTLALEQRPIRGVIALLLVDLNHFKEVNDTLGHAAGDRVLIEVARRLESAAGAEAVVARLGGDEFAVLLRGLTAPAVAAHRAQAMLATLTEPIDIDGMRISVEASIGIATAPSRGGMVELMRRADIAMYQAKRTGARTAVYARARDTADVGRLTLGGDLPRAVAEQEFIVNFQPIVDLTSGEVVAAEALARWQHPDKGALDPRRFLEAVERSGILPAFADAVLDQALLAAVGWREAGFDLPVAVNVSPRSLLDRRFPASVAARLRARDVPPDRLILELTESLTLSQLDVVDHVLGALRDDGIRLALDDFGTGYSSLAMLSRVPVQELKIDREFVAAMETSAEAAAVVRSTVDLGRSLNLTVVAEGVESEPQRRHLWELGCAAGQGHLFARPMPAQRLLAALRRGSGGRPGTLAPPLHDEGTVIRIPTPRRTPNPAPPERLPHWPA
jgi:diguanylate cyclase (GGDEF)-like protein